MVHIRYARLNEKIGEKSYWMLSSNVVNLDQGIRDGIWGLRDKPRLKQAWERLRKGDILFFYATAPTSGIVGFGHAETKFRQDKPLWIDEIRANKVIYPFRFEFGIGYALPLESWDEKRIPIRDLKIGYWAGINLVTDKESISKLTERIRVNWSVQVTKPPEEVKKEPAPEPASLHRTIKDQIYEIGQIHRFISAKEYPMDSQRLDVVWRRVERSVPTYAFEVQIGGDIYHALAKLKHAFDLWNSNLFIIIKPDDKNKVVELLSGTFHEIRNKVNIVTVDKIKRLYELQIEDVRLREEIGLI